MEETLKSAQKPTNIALLKVSFWIITCLIIIHLDTLSNYLEFSNNDLTLKNITEISIYMLVTLVAFRIYRYLGLMLVLPIMNFLDSKDWFNTDDKNIKDRKISLLDMLYYSTQTGDGNIYRHYILLKEETEKKQKTYEFLSYMLLVVSINILLKGSVYNLMLKLDNSYGLGILLVIILMIVSLVYSYKSFNFQMNFYHPNIKEKINKTLRNYE